MAIKMGVVLIKWAGPKNSCSLCLHCVHYLHSKIISAPDDRVLVLK